MEKEYTEFQSTIWAENPNGYGWSPGQTSSQELPNSQPKQYDAPIKTAWAENTEGYLIKSNLVDLV